MEEQLMTEQPLPPAEGEAPEVTAERNARMQDTVQGLANLLMKKAQLSNGAVNVLEMELQIKLLIENTQLLFQLLIDISGGKITDASVTDASIERVKKLNTFLEESMKSAPRVLLATGAPRGLNGSKHN